MTDNLKALDFLDEIKNILTERNKEYGDPTQSFNDIAKRWTVTLGVEINPVQVVLCMIDLKMVRLKKNLQHRDSVIDIIGYAALIEDIKDNLSGAAEMATYWDQKWC